MVVIIIKHKAIIEAALIWLAHLTFSASSCVEFVCVCVKEGKKGSVISHVKVHAGLQAM